MIGFGTAAIGRPQYINIREQDNTTPFDENKFLEKGKRMLSLAYQKGIRHFDTAPGYGMAERILLEWIDENNPKGISVSTKWGYTYVANFNQKAKVHEIKEHSLQKLNEQWEYSSQLLPYLKIYQIHSATLESGVLENIEVLNKLFELKENNGIEIGLSTSGANQNEIIEKALKIKINGVELFDSFQVTFNLFDQSLLEINNTLKSRGKKTIVKEALANGRVFPNKTYHGYQTHYESLKLLAKKYKVGIDAIAIQFCIDDINPYLVLSGASEERHLNENLMANTFHFSTDELIQLEALAINSKDYWAERKQLGWN